MYHSLIMIFCNILHPSASFCLLSRSRSLESELGFAVPLHAPSLHTHAQCGPREAFLHMLRTLPPPVDLHTVPPPLQVKVYVRFRPGGLDGVGEDIKSLVTRLTPHTSSSNRKRPLLRHPSPPATPCLEICQQWQLCRSTLHFWLNYPQRPLGSMPSERTRRSLPIGSKSSVRRATAAGTSPLIGAGYNSSSQRRCLTAALCYRFCACISLSNCRICRAVDWRAEDFVHVCLPMNP
jgi:hypothetical protein